MGIGKVGSEPKLLVMFIINVICTVAPLRILCILAILVIISVFVLRLKINIIFNSIYFAITYAILLGLSAFIGAVWEKFFLTNNFFVIFDIARMAFINQQNARLFMQLFVIITSTQCIFLKTSSLEFTIAFIKIIKILTKPFANSTLPCTMGYIFGVFCHSLRTVFILYNEAKTTAILRGEKSPIKQFSKAIYATTFTMQSRIYDTAISLYQKFYISIL